MKRDRLHFREIASAGSYDQHCATELIDFQVVLLNPQINQDEKTFPVAW